MKYRDTPIDEDAWVWALTGLCQFYQIPFDSQLVLNQFPPPYTLSGLIEAAKGLGFEILYKDVKTEAIPKLEHPSLAILHPGPEHPAEFTPETAGEGACGSAKDSLQHRPSGALALIVKADAERVLFIDAGSHTPSALALREFGQYFAGQLLLCTPKAQEPKDHDTPDRAPKSFGLGWFVPELLKYKDIWRDVVLASLAIQLMALATPLFTQVVIDKVVVHHSRDTLIVVAIILLVFMIFTAVMSWVRQYLVLHTGNRVDAVLCMQVFERILKLPTRYFEDRPTGTIVTRLHAVEQIREFVSSAAVTLFLDGPFLVIFLGLMFYYSASLSLVSLAILIGIVLLSVMIAPTMNRRFNKKFLLGAQLHGFVTEYVAGIETAKALQMEPQLQQKYSELLVQFLHACFRAKQLANTYTTIAATLEQLMSLTVLFFGAWLVMEHSDFSIGRLVAFQMFARRVSEPLLRMVTLWQQFQQVHVAIKRLGDVMDATPEQYSIIPSREGLGLGQITVCSLAFRHAGHLPYLYRDFNAVIASGSAVAIIGPSGCCKSTLAKLLQGFYQPTEGQILIDGQDIRYFTVNELRRKFGVVPQETVLFPGSIFDNLILGNPRASFAEVIQACKLAEIHDVLEQLPQGYQTCLGERGMGLSGGQKQRLAVARALLKHPRILIFDESLSNLDTPTAECMARTINSLHGKVTMLFIAHHLPKELHLDAVIQLGQERTHASRQSLLRG